MTTRTRTAFGLLFAATFLAVASSGAGLAVIFSLPALSPFWLWTQVILAGLAGLAGAIFLAIAYQGSLNLSLLLQDLADRAKDYAARHDNVESIPSVVPSDTATAIDQLLLAKHRVSHGAGLVDDARESLQSLTHKLHGIRDALVSQSSLHGELASLVRELTGLQSRLENNVKTWARQAPQVTLANADLAAAVQITGQLIRSLESDNAENSEKISALLTARERGRRSAADKTVDWSRLSQTSGDLVTLATGHRQNLATLNELADQIHILSLNTKVEATRAQEHHKAIPVIAEELSRLSSQNQAANKSSTEQMSQMQALASDIRTQITAFALKADSDSENEALLRESYQRQREICVKTNRILESLKTELGISENSQRQIAQTNGAQLQGVDVVMDLVKQAASQCSLLHKSVSALHLSAQSLATPVQRSHSASDALAIIFRSISRSLHAADSLLPMPSVPSQEPVARQPVDSANAYAKFVTRRLSRVSKPNRRSKQNEQGNRISEPPSIVIQDLGQEKSAVPQKEVI